MKGQFEKYVNLIRKMAHVYSKKWGMDYDELEAQGFLIYCECIETFDSSRDVEFSTYLVTKLHGIGDFGRKCCKHKELYIEDLIEKENSSDSSAVFENVNGASKISDFVLSKMDKDYNLQKQGIKEFLQYSSNYLSLGAYEVLEWILKREWEKRYRCKPTIKNVMEKFNCSKRVAQQFWAELKMFWNNEGFCFYL